MHDPRFKIILTFLDVQFSSLLDFRLSGLEDVVPRLRNSEPAFSLPSNCLINYKKIDMTPFEFA